MHPKWIGIKIGLTEGEDALSSMSACLHGWVKVFVRAPKIAHKTPIIELFCNIYFHHLRTTKSKTHACLPYVVSRSSAQVVDWMVQKNS